MHPWGMAYRRLSKYMVKFEQLPSQHLDKSDEWDAGEKKSEVFPMHALIPDYLLSQHAWATLPESEIAPQNGWLEC